MLDIDGSTCLVSFRLLEAIGDMLDIDGSTCLVSFRLLEAIGDMLDIDEVLALFRSDC